MTANEMEAPCLRRLVRAIRRLLQLPPDLFQDKRTRQRQSSARRPYV
jgi:hypothetical protein